MTVRPDPTPQNISLELIDPPDDAVRETFDEDELRDLIDDIRENGLINPISVEVTGDRYRVIAGHRRSVACRYAGVSEPPCRVYPADDDRVDSIKSSENKVRAAVNPVHEARWLKRVLDNRCSGDIEQLMKRTGLRFEYVSERLTMLNGDPEIIEAIEKGEINYSVGRELNRYTEERFRRMRLKDAIANGASARLVKQWRSDDERFIEQNPDLYGPDAPPPSALAAGAPSGPACVICRDRKDSHRMTIFYVHDYCDLAVFQKFLESYHGGGNG